MLYEIRLKVSKTMDDGQQKEINEHYICDAELHGEAEAIGYGIYPGLQTDVTSVCRSDVSQIIGTPGAGKCYKATVTENYTDDYGKEKERKYPLLVFAGDFSAATDMVKEQIRHEDGMTLDSVRRVKILDYLAGGLNQGQ